MIGNYQLSFSFVKPSLRERLATIYFNILQALRLLAHALIFGLSLVRFVFWSAILLIVGLPYQLWTAFIPKKNGSLPISKFFRKVFEYQKVKTTIGLALMIVIPLTNILSAQAAAFNEPEEPVVLVEPKEVLTTTQTTFRTPVPGSITTRFSWYHPGIDIADNSDRLIYAAADGQVIEATYSNWGYGNTVLIDHGNGLITRYAHLQQDIRVIVGDKVTKDTALGRVGSTGWSTGPHLHFEVWENGQALNPLLFLPEFSQ
jgi:murein DD-endopeptidase MepM/ murein hydrolase activator NlpD